MESRDRIHKKYGVKDLDAIIGRYVWSNAGRDKDQLFIIVDIADDNHVLLADGDLRRVDRPKKKKLKHLKVTNKVAEEISQAVLARKRLTDSDLRKAVQRYTDELTTYNKGEEV
ncbi:MAG: KOW domain-containing RNA-binding protein [Clostridia bacterium]|nr:KOW domain-containing RNA-binding protein [Clostridia bacterium]